MEYDKHSILFKKIKDSINNKNNLSDELLIDIINKNESNLIKHKKCKVCNKKYESNNNFYGSGCLNYLYSLSKIENSKDITDKELFLHSNIILRLGKTDITGEQMNYVCESYFAKMYFQKIRFINLEVITKELDNCINNNKKPIIKLNIAYRITNILKRNKKKLSMLDKENWDEVIDDTLLKFLKQYFSLSKIANNNSYDVYYYVQLAIWMLAITYGKFNNWDFSSKCLFHSLSIIGRSPKDIYITDKDKNIIAKIKNDEKFIYKIKNIINKYGKDNTVIFNETTAKNTNEIYHTFDGGDLFYSLHSVKISLNGNKIDNKWNLSIRLEDIYDFTEILSNDKFTKNKNKKIITLGNALNDAAAVSSQYGVIKPYKITISFEWSDFNA